jgi:hypothetical protein
MMTSYIVVKEESIRYDDSHSSNDEVAMKEEEWTEHAKGMLKAELKRRGMTYRDLAERLRPLGVIENERNLTNKISRGSFTAAFFLQCLAAIGVQNLRLDDLPKAVESVE